MKIVFFGSSDFAVPSLEGLLGSDHEVLAVVTQPDREKGRNLKLAETPVKTVAAASKGVKVLQPETLKDPEIIKTLESLKPELFVVVAYGGLLPAEVLEIPELYAVNLHPSLLPRYRGAAPVNWSIIKGDKKTGLSVIKMNEALDAGDIILQRKVLIERNETADVLLRRLAELGALLLLDAIRFVESGKAKFKKQPKRTSFFARKLKKEDGLIDWKKDAVTIQHMIRGLDPWPCAFTHLGENVLKIWKADTLPSYQKRDPGSVVDVRSDAVMVACGKGVLLIKEVQLEGKKRMGIEAFIRGNKIEKGDFLGKGKKVEKIEPKEEEKNPETDDKTLE